MEIDQRLVSDVHIKQLSIKLHGKRKNKLGKRCCCYVVVVVGVVVVFVVDDDDNNNNNNNKNMRLWKD